MKNLFLFIGSILLTACGFDSNTSISQETDIPPSPSEVRVYKTFDELAPLIQSKNDTTYVVNFWATTCPPCIKEMPHFAELKRQYKKEKLRILLVSLDLERHLESRVIPFVEKHQITCEVGLLADDNYSAWTDKIDPSWYGALPATLVFKNEDRNFTFGAFPSFEALEEVVKPIVE